MYEWCREKGENSCDFLRFANENGSLLLGSNENLRKIFHDFNYAYLNLPLKKLLIQCELIGSHCDPCKTSSKTVSFTVTRNPRLLAQSDRL